MKQLTIIGLALFSLTLSAQQIDAPSNPQHFIFFSRDREMIHNTEFLSNPGTTGAQITYVWRRLEPQKDQYNFSEIEEDLRFLQTHGKKLFIQIQDVSFDSRRILVPGYMLDDPKYHGGASPQFWEDDKGKLVIGGWVARRWDAAVSERYRKLLIALAEQFDGRITGINMPETSMDIKDGTGNFPDGFSRRKYIEELKKNMLTLKRNFKTSIPLLYANFMPGDSREDLKELYDFAAKIGHGMGGPDIKVYREFQMMNSYPMIRELSGKASTGMAVQEGNYSIENPKTGNPVTHLEVLDFAQTYLKLDYIFWCTEEPFYSEKILPLLKDLTQ